ncbi:MAG: hypothetical protein ACYDAQ_08020 [Mycobacteriales bacterium]
MAASGWNPPIMCEAARDGARCGQEAAHEIEVGQLDQEPNSRPLHLCEEHNEEFGERASISAR